MGFIVFSFLLFLNNLLYLVDLLVSKKAPILIVLQLTVYFLVMLLPFTVPVGILFAIILTYGRFSQDNELMALRSVGISTPRFIWQPLLMSIILSLMLCHVNLYIIPKIHSDFREVYIPLLQKQSVVKFEDKTFIRLADYRIYINKVNKKSDKLLGVNIYKLGKMSTRIFARYGKASFSEDETLIFTLYDGIIQKSLSKEPTKLTQFSFKVYKIVIPLKSKSQLSNTKTLKELNGYEIVKEIQNYKNKKLPTGHLETEYYTRWSISFAALVFCIIGVPFGMKQRGSKSVSIGAGIIIVTIYYLIFIASTTLSERSIFPAKYIMWLNNVATLIPGIILNFKLFRR
jgi:lipopolysaccharide export system permease protein